MRGKGAHRLYGEMLQRITPAYAGKRSKHNADFIFIEDHPRLCGEKLKQNRRYCRKMGSPPPMRGKENACVTDAGNNGITPAYAGKSYGSTSFTLACEDHPRLCGEKF